MQPGGLVQRRVGGTQHVGQRLPQRVFNNGKTPLGLIHGRRPGTADFFGVPGFGDQALQALFNSRLLGQGQIPVILSCQLLGNRIVFLDQGAARDFGRVGREHQLNLKAAELLRQRVRVMPFGQQAAQQRGQHLRLKRLRLVIATPVNQLVLLGDIGQVQKLVERPRDRQHFVIAERIENGAQFFARSAVPVVFGTLADAFDLGEKRVAVLVTNRITQQLTQQVNIIAQACINIGHQPFLQQILGEFVAQECVAMGVAGKPCAR